MTDSLLRAEGLSVRFGGLMALDDVGFELAGNGFTGLIGPNGAGKTTLLRAITGVRRPDRGRVFLDGRDVTGLPVQARARLGLGLSQQLVRPFRTLSLLDNVALAAGGALTRSPWQALISTNRSGPRARARELLALVGISEAADMSPAGQPLGVLKRLEVARALALEPRLLLLDEPLAGLNSAEARRLADTIVEVNARGVTVLLIEHNLREVLRVCRDLLVLDQGRLIAHGEPREVMGRPDVRAAYMGQSSRRGGGDAAA